MNKATVFAIHGFLGLPSDWDFLEYAVPLEAVDLANFCCPTNGFKEWAVQFNTRAKKTPGRKIIMGYSLGGRLAMHALLHDPDLWEDSHNHIKPSRFRIIRRPAKTAGFDLAWADRFGTIIGNVSLMIWNNQTALKEVSIPAPKPLFQGLPYNALSH